MRTIKYIFLLLSCYACQQSSKFPVSRTLEEEIVVERLDQATYSLHIEQPGVWKVYAGSALETIDWQRPRFTLTSTDTLLTTPFSPRTFWGLLSSQGDTLIVSEREIPLKGALNFRDLGGLPTESGRRVKWGLFYRSGKLNGLKPADHETLNALGLKNAVDFRSDEEVAEEPDNLPPAIAYQRVVIGIDQAIDRDQLMDSLKTMTPDQSANLLVAANELFAGDAAKDYQAFVDLFTDASELPLVFHCTAGKDRTGFGAALILSTLGVSRETILQDFLMSNYYRQGHGNFRMKFAWLVGLDRKVLEPLMEVRPAYLEAAFATIDSLYGDTPSFLEEVYGINDSLRTELIQRYTY